MDFDEYDYLEKTVENSIPSKEDSTTINGVNSDLKEKRKTSSRTRSDDVDLDAERPSKRDRHEDRVRHRERASSRHHSNAERDGEKERRSRRDERDGRDKDRHRDKYRDMEKERTRDRDGDSEMEREYEHERERSRRSHSRSERHREEERDKIKEMDRELDRERERSRRSHSRSERHRDEERDRYREKSRERNRERDGRHCKEKKEEAAEPEADPERDQRTVFAYQINLKADERDVYEFFSRAGKVRDVRLIMDRNSRRSKGVGYIEFYDAMSVPMAIALTGQKLLGQAVMVKPSEAEKNLVQSTSTVAGGTGVFGAQSAGGRKLYVGNLHFNINEEQLRAVFESFGTVELVQLPLDSETGHCKGFAFIQFARLEDAKVAQTINGQLEIAGRTIKVSAVTDQVVGQDTGASGGDLDDDEGGGLALNACDRALLMQKLDRSGTATSVANTIIAPAPNPVLPLPTASVLGIPPIVNHLAQPPFPALAGLPAGLSVGAAAVDSVGIPSECLLLKNMFDPSIETEPDFDLDIKEDVEDECSKYGAVKHIFVDKNSAGFVYLQFDNITSSSNAQHSLHGRWFAGKMITATFMVPCDYAVKFPYTS